MSGQADCIVLNGLPCPVIELIPQKGKMGLEQILTVTNGDDGQSTAVIKADNLFLDDRRQLSSIVLIEYVNQLVAAAQGYKELTNNEAVKRGLFVGLQEAEFLRPVYLGDTLIFKKSLAEEVAPVNFVQGIVERADVTVATFITKIYEVKELQEFGGILNSGATDGIKTAVDGLKKTTPPVYLNSSLQRQLYDYIQDLNINGDGITFQLSCPADFGAFDGHFPGNPILPGIILLEIAQLALKLFLQQPVLVKTVKKMKINGMVFPDQVIAATVKVEAIASGGGHSFSAVFKTENGREVSRFNGSCEVEREL